MAVNNLLYAKVKQGIIESIDNKEYRPNTKIPSEKNLCDTYDVSRITVRKAIKELVEEGILNTYQGKGTFVINEKIENELLEVGGFTDFGIDNNRNTKQITISCEVVSSERHCTKLNVPHNSKFLKLLRVMWLDDEPFFIDCSHIPLDTYKDFDKKYRIGDSTYRLLREEYKTNVLKDDKVIHVKMAGSLESKLLECSVGEPLFYIQKLGLDDNNNPVHTSELFCRANRVSLTINNKS